MSSPAGTSSRPTRCARSTGSRTPTTPTLLEDGSWCARQPQRAPPSCRLCRPRLGGGPQRRRAGGAPVTSHGPDDSIPSLAAKPLTSQATSGSWERGAMSLCPEHRRSRGRRSGRARRSRSCRPARWGGSTGRTRPLQLRLAWGSVTGARLWYALHGYAVAPPRTQRRSIGHGRVLPPGQRQASAARVLARQLVVKAARRISEGRVSGVAHHLRRRPDPGA